VQAFKPGAPVLQNGGKAAPMQITLPEDFDYGSLHHFDEEEFNRMYASWRLALDPAYTLCELLPLSSLCATPCHIPISFLGNQRPFILGEGVRCIDLMRFSCEGHKREGCSRN
jgi:hypothetical protein